MSEQNHGTGHDSGRSLDRTRQDRTLERASRQESWIEQLQRIHEQAKGKPRSNG